MKQPEYSDDQIMAILFMKPAETDTLVPNYNQSTV